MVHEDIVSGSATYKSVAFVVVEPLYCSLLFHALFFPVSVDSATKAEGYWLSGWVQVKIRSAIEAENKTGCAPIQEFAASL
jgi:hypothetical protein